MQAPTEPVRLAFDQLKAAAERAPMPTAAEREDRLERLERLLVRHRDEFVKAIAADFGLRVRAETLSADLLMTLDSARHARRHLRGWMARQAVPVRALHRPSKAFVEYLPLGVVAVIAPWNYPVNLAFGPVVGALAAGNRVLLKPSELTSRTGQLIERLVAEHFTPEELAVVNGGPEVAQAITGLPLDHLFFTGSTTVGRLVAQAAAQNLVPVTLELGGKSPALIHDAYELARAAERLVIGKLFNAGQTCIAPDYVLCAAGRAERLVAELRAATARLYPRLGGMSSLVSEKARARLEALLADARAKGATVVELEAGGHDRVMAPCALLNVSDQMRVMQEEIFGPLLPIETYETLDEAIARIQARPRPLAFYYFDEDLRRADQVLSRVVSGGATVNDTLAHFAQEDLPFGGVGSSGMGAYHGRRGFETFSHARSVLVASGLSPASRLFRPPFGPLLERALELLVRGR